MDRKLVIIGLLAVGMIFLIPKKKTKAKNIKVLSGLGRYERTKLPTPKNLKVIPKNFIPYQFDDGFTIFVNPDGIEHYGDVMTDKGYKEKKYKVHASYSPDGKFILWESTDGLKRLTKGKPSQMVLFGLSDILLNTRKVCRADITKKKIHCRVQNPKEFGAFFMRTSTTPGVKYVMGMPLGTEKAILQSVLFDKHIWDTKQAKIWFNRNIKRLLQKDKKILRLDDLGKGKIHDEDYFSPRQQEMFPGMRRELVLEAEDNASIFTVDPLDICLERQGWNLKKVKEYQESISAKMTADMFGKQEKLSGKEIMLQETIQKCLERITNK